MRITDDTRLKEILVEMRIAIDVSQNNEERAHQKADALLIKAAKICGVPQSIIAAYEKVEKFYA